MKKQEAHDFSRGSITNIIACNLGSYRQFGANAYSHLAEIGLTNVEIGVPSADGVEALQSELKAHGPHCDKFTRQL